MRLGIRALLHALRKPFQGLPRKEGRRSADRRTTGFRSAAARKACQRMRRALCRFLPRIGAEHQEAARSPFGAPPRHCAEGLIPRLGSGPRFLESPDASGRTLSGTSAASTWQSDHAPDGTMPRTARTQVTSPLPGTAPAPSIGCHRSTSLRWASLPYVTMTGTMSRDRVGYLETAVLGLLGMERPLNSLKRSARRAD